MSLILRCPLIKRGSTVPVKDSVSHRQCFASFRHRARLNHLEYGLDGKQMYPLSFLNVESFKILRTSAAVTDCQNCSSCSRAIPGLGL